MKGTKRYGRRSRPDKTVSVLTADSEDSLPFATEQDETPSTGLRRAKLRRSTSLESVEVRIRIRIGIFLCQAYISDCIR